MVKTSKNVTMELSINKETRIPRYYYLAVRKVTRNDVCVYAKTKTNYLIETK